MNTKEMNIKEMALAMGGTDIPVIRDNPGFPGFKPPVPVVPANPCRPGPKPVECPKPVTAIEGQVTRLPF